MSRRTLKDQYVRLWFDSNGTLHTVYSEGCPPELVDKVSQAGSDWQECRTHGVEVVDPRVKKTLWQKVKEALC